MILSCGPRGPFLKPRVEPMKERFNVEQWLHRMQTAIAARDAEWLAELMHENDPNGVFSYDEYCREFGIETTPEEWGESTVECAEMMLEQVESEL